MTGFGNYKYYGVMGSGDTRTGEARQAKTVDFDVVKDNRVDQTVSNEAPKTDSDISEVEFDIDQPVE